MNEIIKISEHDGKCAVNARELHRFLGVGKDFSSWIKDRIIKYQFIENQDFEVFTDFGENPNGGRPQIEYALSIDMAKELSMVENNERGRMARRYFIECEKKIQQPTLIEEKLKVIEFASRFLNMNDVSKLKMLKAVTDPLGLPTPNYVQSKGVLKSAKELLKANDCGISSIAFNKLAVKAGLLEDKTRNSSHGEIKHFKSITAKGSAYGENQVNPNNPKETQPLWYEDKFGEVVKIIGL